MAGAGLLDLKRLSDRALIRYRVNEKRYRLHRLVQQFSAEKLPAPQSARQAHGQYFVDWTVQQAEGIHSPAYFDVVRAILVEYDNIRAAWDTAVETLNVRWLDQLAEPLRVVRLGDMGRLHEGHDLFEAATIQLQQAGKFPLSFMAVSGHFLNRVEKNKAAVGRLRRVLNLAEDIPDIKAIASIYLVLTYNSLGQASDCYKTSSAALELLNEVTDPFLQFGIYNVASLSALENGSACLCSNLCQASDCRLRRAGCASTALLVSHERRHRLLFHGQHFRRHRHSTTSD